MSQSNTLERVDAYPTRVISGLNVRVGRLYPFGATLIPGGINFAIFSRHATACTLVLFQRGEEKPFAELPFPPEFRIGDVRNYADACSAVRDADIVVNAAALKQVPSCEYFPLQALLTNCVGPSNIVRAIQEHGFPVETVIGISTDKACKPVNVMGMTKAIQERIFARANLEVPGTRFVIVRYGNVLASRGSVIPLFHEQIKAGGPVTITDPRMTRFLLSLEEAVDVGEPVWFRPRQAKVFLAPKEAAAAEDYAI